MINFIATAIGFAIPMALALLVCWWIGVRVVVIFRSITKQ